MGLFGFLGEIASAIWSGIKALWRVCTKIIRAVISFTLDIIAGLIAGVALLLGYEPYSVEESPIKPFVADMDKLMASAPVVEVGVFGQKNKNLMKGLYDARTGQIHEPTYIGGDQLDSQTRQVIGNESIVILG
jgi:hypothetical protein